MRTPARALLALLAIAGIAACKDKRSDEAKPVPVPVPADAGRPAEPDKLEGTLTLDGKPLELVKCRPGREGSIYVDLVTAAGALRFVGGEAAQMYWRPGPDGSARGAPPERGIPERGIPIECSIPHRSWGGGTRADGSTYFRGELAFSCRGAAGVLDGKVSVDCGNISPLERRLLDESRDRKREELRPAGQENP
jgi:hypothetical protein